MQEMQIRFHRAQVLHHDVERAIEHQKVRLHDAEVRYSKLSNEVHVVQDDKRKL